MKIMKSHNMLPDVFLRSLFDIAIAAVSAEKLLAKYIPVPPKGKTVILAFGKGAASMAAAFVKHYNAPYDGLIVTCYGHYDQQDEDLKNFEVIEASHPIPCERSIEGGKRALELVESLGEDDLVVALISGGGSALLTVPVAGITLENKCNVTRSLLSCGATIEEINCVRKHLSKIKGGRLAQAVAPAKIVTLAVSDVVGNDPSMIASGPTVEDNSTLLDAQAIIIKYRIEVPQNVFTALHSNSNRTPNLSDPIYDRNECHIVTTPKDALDAAKDYSLEQGYEVIVLGDTIEGEARMVAVEHAKVIKGVEKTGVPTIILSGGEVTVTLSKDHGVGGGNTEYSLALAMELDGMDNIWGIACDTDGKDGSGDNAGAIFGPDSLSAAASKGLKPAMSLSHNDSYTFFKAINSLVITGPTHTNVNDFRALIVN